MAAYYNEIDAQAAQWLRNLIGAGVIARGDVDERSIEDVRPDDLKGYTQCHFFAGLGGWSYALRRAGWSDDRPVWTGSCPCQPISIIGKGAEFADDRHLWPAWMRLISQREPLVIFGEQVASKDGLAWLDVVSTDLEGARYTFGAVDTCAAGFGAPHIRQRFYFVADAGGAGLEGQRGHGDVGGESGWFDMIAARPTATGGAARGPVNGFWSGAEWIACSDGKRRPVRPGTFPMAHGIPARVVRVRAYGNAINAEQASEFVMAYMSLAKPWRSIQWPDLSLLTGDKR